MQRFTNDLVGDVGAIEVAGVDVVYAARDRLAQHRQGRAMIFGRAKHARTSELHGAIAKPLHAAAAEVERAGLIDSGHDLTPFKR
jgi:ABC-type methionine transport system ATPase subunit